MRVRAASPRGPPQIGTGPGPPNAGGGPRRSTRRIRIERHFDRGTWAAQTTDKWNKPPRHVGRHHHRSCPGAPRRVGHAPRKASKWQGDTSHTETPRPRGTETPRLVQRPGGIYTPVKRQAFTGRGNLQEILRKSEGILKAILRNLL